MVERCQRSMAFPQSVSGMETALHPRRFAEKANTAYLEIVGVNYGSSTEMVRFIARQGNPQTSYGLQGPYEPRSRYGIRLR